MRFYNIPIFIPELACPHKCIFCNQSRISGQIYVPQPNEIRKIVDKYLETIPQHNSRINIAFFGGSFTCIDPDLQKKYLIEAAYYVDSMQVHGIRISTRPDYITDEGLSLLKKYHVSCIELGAQSFSDDVLLKSGRGHTAHDVVNASKLIKSYGFELGLQLMLGLPADNKTKFLNSVDKIIELGADNTRLYPALVIKDTALEQLFVSGKYTPLALYDAVDWVKDAYLKLIKHNVTVLRVGLHPSEELNSSKSLVAGPYHTSFLELVYNQIWNEKFVEELPKNKGKLVIKVAPSQINYAVGYGGVNKKYLKEKYGWIKIISDSNLNNFDMDVCYC